MRSSLNHPNIAAILRSGRNEWKRFLVLELVEGETLADRIRRGPIPVEEALDIAKLMRSLEAAHEKGIIHRDLKPANVKITPDGKVKVLDFGLAKAMEKYSHRAETFQLADTKFLGHEGGHDFWYRIVHVARNRRKVQDRMRSDVFSFGSVFYEMLTGRPGISWRVGLGNTRGGLDPRRRS